MRSTTKLLRSAADATRFTATSPHAYSSPTPIRRAAAGTFTPSAPSSRPTFNNAPPPPSQPTETPAQKVARLRAARLREKAAQVSTWDKVVVTGREWADRVHRTVAWGLIGFTVLAAGITAYALTDMIVYNRRKRNAWMADQVAYNEALVTSAIANQRANLPLSPEQQLALDNERARFEARERKAAKGGWGRWMLTPFESLVGGLRAEEVVEKVKDGEYRAEGAEEFVRGVEETLEKAEEGLERLEGQLEHGVKNVETGLKEAVQGNLGSGGKQAEEGVLASVREAEKVASGRSTRGGPLDKLAENVVEGGKEKVKGGWSGWFCGK